MSPQNSWGEIIQRSLGVPTADTGLGPTREFQEKARQASEAWLRMISANLMFQGLLAETWMRVFERLTRELWRADGETIRRPRDIVNRSIDVADQVFGKAFDSDSYLELQGELTNATAAYRVREAEIVEILLKGSHLATKSELDQTTRVLYELQREVRRLRGEVEAQAESAQPGARRRRNRQRAQEGGR